ncbi:MAG: hypothetical protein K9N34_09280 [Candidatus Marinimicrobia bacterium]|nr:hypothetical protein [Candidatus Neomarinimicrobiota bacterium]MCF7839970.1 hypothetical protein [Candidatus Neomarinimicrobiota bacterium]
MSNRKIKSKDSRLGWILSMAGVGVLGMIILLQLTPAKPNLNSRSEIGANENYSALTFLVSTQFDCSCNECKDVVSDCTCPTGKATKDYIEQKVQQGYKKQEIIDLVKDAFGHFRG